MGATSVLTTNNCDRFRVSAIHSRGSASVTVLLVEFTHVAHFRGLIRSPVILMIVIISNIRT
jgi:hypothetical protein